MSQITYFAYTNFRDIKKKFGIKLRDRFYHFYTFGKSGAGKTTLLKTKALSDIKNNFSVCFIDPHGDAVKEIYNKTKNYTRVIYFDVTDPNMKYGYNPIRKVPYHKRSLIASSILEVFKRQWKSAWGMKMEHILRMVLLTLLDQSKADFSDINRLLQDTAYQKACIGNIRNPDVQRFWEEEFP